MRKIYIFSIILSVLFILSIGCNEKSSSPKSKVDDNGLTPAINDFVPDSLLDILDSLGMPINRGENPPNIEGVFLSSPFQLLNSNRPSDVIGQIYADYYVQFSGQNNNNLTVFVDYVNGPENGTGLGGFIVGTTNNFSVFTELEVVVGQDTAYILNLISGTMEQSGIDNFYLALFMIDNLGNPSGYFINNGDGRIFWDQDGTANEVSSLPKKSTDLLNALGKTAATIRKF